MATMSETMVRRLAGQTHIERGNATGEWVVGGTACWSAGEVLMAADGEARIERLRQEAGEAGDTAQVTLCDLALAGDREAIEECAQVIGGGPVGG